jgi:hypothetical protein
VHSRISILKSPKSLDLIGTETNPDWSNHSTTIKTNVCQENDCHFERAASLKLDRLEAAVTLKDLAALPGNRFEAHSPALNECYRDFSPVDSEESEREESECC